MRTTKSVSTISYNSMEYLKLKLDELVDAKKISFWVFIKHKREEDEEKDHIHLFCEPSKMIQTDDLKDYLKEFDPLKPEKPKTTISWNISKFGDWYLYCIHDEKYLASKNQSRKFHYKTEEFITSDEDDFKERIRQIDMISLSPFASMEDAQRQGLSFGQYFSRGLVNPNQVIQMQRAWDILMLNRTDRNGRKGHEVIDEETGEILTDN